MLPDYYDISRTIRINRSLDETFSYTSNLNNWEQWLPTSDSNIKYNVQDLQITWSSPQSGKSSYRIDSITINKRLDFVKNLNIPKDPPVKQYMLFDFDGASTYISWHQYDSLSYPFERWMNLIMKGKIKKQFELGLINLQKVLEAQPPKPKTHVKYQFITTREIKVYIIRDSVETMDNISEKLEQGYSEIERFLSKNNIPISAPPMNINVKYDNKSGKYVFEVAMAVDSFAVKPEGRIKTRVLPSTEALLAAHWGHYNFVNQLYKNANDKIDSAGYKTLGYSWEQYVNDPNEVQKDKIETHVYIPIIKKKP